jgi:hypothetical protein
MKATFNGKCDRCLRFKARCAQVFTTHGGLCLVLCKDCRTQSRGLYRLTDQHKKATK